MKGLKSKEKKLKRKRKFPLWTKEEDNILFQYWGKLDKSQLYSLLPSRSALAIKLRVKKLLGVSTNYKYHSNIICIETGEIFKDLKSIQTQLNINSECIRNCLNGIQKTAGGYHWRYLNKEELKWL